MKNKFHSIKDRYGSTIGFYRYTRRELEKAWAGPGQGNAEARAMGDSCALYPTKNKEEALILSALLIRNVFAVPTCAHWDGNTLSFYAGDAGRGAPATIRRAELVITCYRLGFVDEHGPLFEEENEENT